MKKVLVTGSRGFIGKNLMEVLLRRDDIQVSTFDSTDDVSCLCGLLEDVDIVYHLAGVNRPSQTKAFEKENVDLTATMVALLEDLGSNTRIVFASSTQALENNPYGVSKKKAEGILVDYEKVTGAEVRIYRLKNVFGKWCRPNYNSVVATFCHNISHGLYISISDRQKEIEMIYIDDVITSFVGILEDINNTDNSLFHDIYPTYKITLGDLADRIFQFRESRRTLVMPDFSDDFSKRLYATYLSYLEPDDFSYELEARSDERGSLAEMIKSYQFGQIFVSTTKAGVIRGNHYHETKVEKFIVIKGEALISFRHVLEDDIVSYRVSGKKLEVVDIPPGFTHSIENLSDDEMIVLFWADEIFDPDKPDTYFSEV